MTRTITVKAPAKINLTLDVFAPRPDGYHDLDSIVIKMAPFDTITISVDDSGFESCLIFSTDDDSLPRDGTNLVERAARAFLDRYPVNGTIHIHLSKRIPAQAGLGGGSSDAAATLRGLAKLFDVPSEILSGIGATLGSDIPLFLIDGPVRMEGKGERVTPIRCAPRLFGVIARPQVGVPTPTAYRILDKIPHRQAGIATARMLTLLLSGASVQDIAFAMDNDFEAAVYPQFPEVAAVSRILQEAGTLRTLLSGSGSAVFGLTGSSEQADAIVRNLSGHIPYIVTTRVWNE